MDCGYQEEGEGLPGWRRDAIDVEFEVLPIRFSGDSVTLDMDERWARYRIRPLSNMGGLITREGGNIGTGSLFVEGLDAEQLADLAVLYLSSLHEGIVMGVDPGKRFSELNHEFYRTMSDGMEHPGRYRVSFLEIEAGSDPVPYEG